MLIHLETKYAHAFSLPEQKNDKVTGYFVTKMYITQN